MACFLAVIFGLLLTFNYKTYSYTSLCVVFFCFGFFSNAVCCLIAGAAAIDAAQKAEEFGANSTGKIIGFIDGFGSLGSTLGNLVLSFTIKHSWKYGFLMVEFSIFSLSLIPQAVILNQEIKEIKHERKK